MAASIKLGRLAGPFDNLSSFDYSAQWEPNPRRKTKNFQRIKVLPIVLSSLAQSMGTVVGQINNEKSGQTVVGRTDERDLEF